jgi:three-Cys-motif partner protein
MREHLASETIHLTCTETKQVTQQDEFGGSWTQQKLEALGKYLRAYTTIFKRNPFARYYSITYVDAFAGTGTLKRPEPGRFATLIPDLRRDDEQFRKGSVKRALEIEPPFDHYFLIERDPKKCAELRTLAQALPGRNITVENDDANAAILKWCRRVNTARERAVVFLDPFGASVKWEAIVALGRTRAVDLWVLFPYSAINRMLVRDRKPPKAWADRLTAVFGTPDWEKSFYSTSRFRSLLDSQAIERVHRSASHRDIIDFFVERLKGEFVAVSEPLPLYNSRGSLLFILFFAAGNEKSAKTGLKIANSIIGR